MRNQEEITNETYKELLCEMIRKLEDSRFLKQIYGIVYRHLYK